MEQNKGGVRNAATGILETNINEMKMIIMILILMAFLSDLTAPPYQSVYIAIPEEINYYTPLIKAVVKVESNNGKYQFNEKENAVGYFQIRECRINDYNKRTGKNYTHSEMYDYEKSKEVFLYFAQGKTYEKASKDWNGSGPMTKIYWSKVQKALL